MNVCLSMYIFTHTHRPETTHLWGNITRRVIYENIRSYRVCHRTFVVFMYNRPLVLNLRFITYWQVTGTLHPAAAQLFPAFQSSHRSAGRQPITTCDMNAEAVFPSVNAAVTSSFVTQAWHTR